MKYVLVTGGLGYIGSHIVIELLKHYYKVIIIDNLSNSSEQVYYDIKKICEIENLKHEHIFFYDFDMDNEKILNHIFSQYNIDYVIHMASYKSVSESIDKPLMYYKNNIDSLLILLQCMKNHNMKHLIFSSSATVYGNSIPPFYEYSETGKGLTNPYGKTKYICEEILKDMKDMNIYILRYFNPIGCHKSGLIGENTNGIPNNIMHYLLRVATHQYKHLNVFGNDYNTNDGTPERDYIHVVDLANAHVCILNNMNKGVHIYNIGTGKPTSVFNLIHTFEEVNNIKINYNITKRREGDVAVSYCNCDKIKNDFNWNPKYTLEDMCKDSWNYMKINSN